MAFSADSPKILSDYFRDLLYNPNDGRDLDLSGKAGASMDGCFVLTPSLLVGISLISSSFGSMPYHPGLALPGESNPVKQNYASTDALSLRQPIMWCSSAPAPMFVGSVTMTTSLIT